jgi:hypothetical protein
MRTVTILLNYRCPFKCRHCSQGFSDSYRGTPEALKPAALKAIIRGIDPSVYKVGLLAGGEPSLNPELAALGIKECARAGLTSALITAPVWAASPDAAGRFLDKMAGLNLLILSYDQFHLDFLSLLHYKNAAMKAMERGIHVEIAAMYLDETDRKRQLYSLRPLQGMVDTVTTAPVISVGNAAALAADPRKPVRITSAASLAALPRTCTAGKVVYVDKAQSLYGCCWSVYAGKTPLDLPARAGEPLRKRFARLERAPALAPLLARGFLSSLSARGAARLAAALKGRAYHTECDLCMDLMRSGCPDAWNDIAGAAGRKK